MKWKTKDGKLIEVKDMTDNHLLNTQRYMQRRVKDIQEESSACAGMCFQGEMAQYYQEQETDALVEQVLNAVDVLRYFNDELKHRKLEPLEVVT